MPTNSAQAKSAFHHGCKIASRYFAAFLALLFIFTAVPNAEAVTKADINALKKQQQQINTNKANLQGKISAVQNDTAKAAEKKALLEEQISEIYQELTVTNSLIQEYTQQIADKAVELQKAEEEETRYYDLFCERVRAMEEGEEVNYWSILFSADDFSDLIDKVNMISEIMDYDNHVMDELAIASAAVADAKQQLETLRSEQDANKRTLESSKAELDKQEKALEAVINEMKAKESQYKEQLDELSEDYVDLSNDISSAEKKYAAQLEAARKQQQASSGSSSSSSGGKVTLTGNGGFIWPLSGYTQLSSKYGGRTHPITGRKSTHGGIDIPAKRNAKIAAAKSGTVVISGYHSSYGNYVVIAHGDGSKTLYAHMNSRACSAGDSVSQGQVIGYVGSTGSSTGNHLHFEVWLGSLPSSRTNPMKFFS